MGATTEENVIVALMGVAGVGKTTVGKRLAQAIGWQFYDGDDFHPPANVDKMAQGIPLTDADRIAWLDALQKLINGQIRQGQPAVIACSALKRSYRRRLLHDNEGVRFVHLQGSYDLIQSRLRARRGHFFRADLLAGQFDALEAPADVLVVDVSDTPAGIVRTIRNASGL